MGARRRTEPIDPNQMIGGILFPGSVLLRIEEPTTRSRQPESQISLQRLVSFST